MQDLITLSLIIGILSGFVAILNGLANLQKYLVERQRTRPHPEGEEYDPPRVRRDLLRTFRSRALLSFVIASIIILPILSWGMISTPTPTPVVTTTSVLLVEPTSVPAPTPSCLSQTLFPDIARNYQFGCATKSITSTVGFQKFQKGMMIYREDTGVIYALFKNTEKWEDRIAPSWELCPEVDPILGPILGFGNLWCDYWQNQLGRPVERESTLPGSKVEEYRSGGFVIDLGHLGGLIFLPNRTYRAF